ncbi:hypothetical protein KEM52_003783, partial [Ascosphaera acerosa]
MNRLVMDYLVSAGYPTAAANFAQEAEIAVDAVEGWSFPGAQHTVAARASIRNALLKGEVMAALAEIHAVEPLLLDRCPSLHFSLLHLHLMELIRPMTTWSDADIGPALAFATQNLAPIAPTHDRFLRILEDTMCLLIYPHDKLDARMLALLDRGLRAQVAARVNRAMLLGSRYEDDLADPDARASADSSSGASAPRKYCKLGTLVKLRHCVEAELRSGVPVLRGAGQSFAVNGAHPHSHSHADSSHPPTPMSPTARAAAQSQLDEEERSYRRRRALLQQRRSMGAPA